MRQMDNDIINPALMLAISRMKENNNTATQNKMVEEAMNARFLVPCVVKFKPGTEKEVERNPGNTIVNFNMMKTTSDDMYFIAFTDMGELKKWQDNENQNVMVMSFDDLAGLVLNSQGKSAGFAINPSTTNVAFRKEIIETIIANRDRAIAEGKLVKVSGEQAKEILRARAEEGKSEA